MKKIGLGLLLVIPCLVACGPQESEYEPPFVPKQIAFEGEVKREFVGDWKTADGSSEMKLSKDGSLSLITVANSRNGPSKSEVKGKWAVADKRLLLQYGQTTLEYEASLTGAELLLNQTGGSIKTAYKKIAAK